MISKQAAQAFGNDMFAEMDRVLKENYAHVHDITKEAEKQSKATALSELIGTLAKSGSQLEKVGHPARLKVDSVLRYIETNILK